MPCKPRKAKIGEWIIKARASAEPFGHAEVWTFEITAKRQHRTRKRALLAVSEAMPRIAVLCASMQEHGAKFAINGVTVLPEAESEAAK